MRRVLRCGCLCYSLGITQSVDRGTFSILEEETLFCLFLDEFEMSGIALFPDRSRSGPVFDIASEPWLFTFRVKVVFRFVAWCGTARRRGTRRVWVCVESGDAVETKSSDGTNEGIAPDGSSKAFTWVFFIASRGGGGRGG